MKPNREFWSGKKVLLTGHTGFKGAWMALWLNQLGAKVTGVGLEPASEPSLFDELGIAALIDSYLLDIRDFVPLQSLSSEANPDIVIHMAAQALVREGYSNPLETYSTNLMGTVNILEAIRDIDSVRTAVVVTTDKVYRNNEWHFPYREDDVLGGKDPYSASKAASELVVSSYRDAFLRSKSVATASVRAGNVIGGGDWSADRLIPDAVRAWQDDGQLTLRNPGSTRPWQHVLDPLAGYLGLIEKLWEHPNLAGAYNIGPDTGSSRSVKEVIEIAHSFFCKGTIAVQDEVDSPTEAGRLALDASKARHELGFQPRWDLELAINRTMSWYQSFNEGASARDLCLRDIAAYES